MDYEQKYKDVLEQMRGFTPDERGLVLICPSDLFPELKESEEERMRKNLLELVAEHCGKTCEMYLWLEKQGEQKPAWSEVDDDNMIMIEDRFSDYLDYIREDSSITKHRKNSLKEEIFGYVNWLKSLKERYTWKPSDEQIMYIGEAIDIAEEASKYNVVTALKEIREQLKKLREE